ncbi:DUF366 family protein [Desulfurispora thermophila]|uniref:DUF366 family protein n=1 Tax=Desulfurispora thermophila TaxID=265470 RepID=UPI00036BE79A|nr:DUF366 family protein [Desulfurispora thermophila]
MHYYLVPGTLAYTGHQLCSLWAYKNFGLLGDSIVAFRGPCSIDWDEMVDVEDVLDRSPIYGPDMLHFIVEHFSIDLDQMICRQRLFMALIGEQLTRDGHRVERQGDDLYISGRKLSISIATASPVSVLMHVGLNLVSEGTPVPAVGLWELGYREEALGELAARFAEAYRAELAGMARARCKVRGVS